MGQALRKPKIVPSPSRTRTRAEGGEGVQPPLLVQIRSRDQTSSSPLHTNPENAPDRRLELGERLRSAGIFPRKARELAAAFPTGHIEGWLEAWEADRAGAEGVGALVWRIEHEEPPELRRSAEADWLERRYATGRNP